MSDAQKDEIAKRAAAAQMKTIFGLPETAHALRANLEEAAYRALSDYEALREPPSLSVAPLHVEPDDPNSPIESHDVYLRIGELAAVEEAFGAGVLWTNSDNRDEWEGVEAMVDRLLASPLQKKAT